MVIQDKQYSAQGGAEMTARGHLIGGVVAVLGLVLTGGSPAMAVAPLEPAPAAGLEDAGVHVAFLAGPTEVGEVLDRADIPVTRRREESDGRLGGTDQSDSTMGPIRPPDEWDRLAIFYDWKSRRVALRKGYWDAAYNAGHNERKMRGKHNLYLNPARGAVQYAYWESSGGGSSIWYQAIIALLECGSFGCTVVDTEQIRVLIDHRKLSDGDTFGAVTGYCDGKTYCLNWVNQSGVY
jgi:hypothetical protein